MVASRTFGLIRSSRPGFGSLLIPGITEPIYVNASPTAITPSVSAELLANPSFAAWTLDNPDSWTVTGEVLADPEVTERDTGQLHAAVKTVGGSANMFATVTAPGLRQNSVMTVGLWYLLVGTCSAYGSGVFAYDNVGNGAAGLLAGTGTFTRTDRAVGTYLGIRDVIGGACNFTHDSFSLKELTNVLVAQHVHHTPVSYSQCALTMTANTQAGIYQRHAASGDYVLAYVNRYDAKLVLVKVVGGTLTEIGSATITYTAGNVLKLLHRSADKWQVFYDTAANIDIAPPLITVTNVTDANLDQCDQDGLFSTDSGSTFASYKWVPQWVIEQYNNASPSSISPTLGSEIVVNGNFSSWAGDNPTGWTVGNESAGTKEISERGAGQSHASGPAGTGLANYWYNGAGSLELYQTILTTGTFYRVLVDINTVVSGSITQYLGLDNKSYSTTGSKAWTGRAGSAIFWGAYGTATADITLDNVSVKAISNMLAQQHTHVTPPSYSQCALTVTDATQAGVYQRHASSGDYVLGYLDRSGANDRVIMIKVVSGVVTEISAVIVAYVAGNVLKLKHHVLNGWQLFYDTPGNIDAAAAKITTTSISDANLNNCNEDGLFSTDAATTFSAYKWDVI